MNITSGEEGAEVIKGIGIMGDVSKSTKMPARVYVRYCMSSTEK